jgi:hypothetical protein
VFCEGLRVSGQLLCHDVNEGESVLSLLLCHVCTYRVRCV